MSGAAGAPEKKGLSLYGCVVPGGAYRGHHLLPSASCRRPARPGPEAPQSGFRQQLRGARFGCRDAQVDGPPYQIRGIGAIGLTLRDQP
jgi:hypothetical protein